MKIKLSIPFIVFALILLIFVSPTMLFVYFASVILHEIAHSQAASVFNCRLDNIRLYPFGAIIFGNIDNLSPIEEIIIALAGVVFNAFIAFFCIAIWWIIPASYYFTETVVYANISLCLFNLIPVYPLDGGKVVYALLSQKTGHTPALRIVKILGYCFAAALFVLFLASCFFTLNFSLLTTSMLLFYSALDKKSNLTQKRMAKLCLDKSSFEKGINVKHIAVFCNLTLEEVYKKLNPDFFYFIHIYNQKLEHVATIDQMQFLKRMERGGMFDRII